MKTLNGELPSALSLVGVVLYDGKPMLKSAVYDYCVVLFKFFRYPCSTVVDYQPLVKCLSSVTN